MNIINFEKNLDLNFKKKIKINGVMYNSKLVTRNIINTLLLVPITIRKFFNDLFKIAAVNCYACYSCY